MNYDLILTTTCLKCRIMWYEESIIRIEHKRSRAGGILTEARADKKSLLSAQRSSLTEHWFWLADYRNR